MNDILFTRERERERGADRGRKQGGRSSSTHQHPDKLSRGDNLRPSDAPPAGRSETPLGAAPKTTHSPRLLDLTGRSGPAFCCIIREKSNSTRQPTKIPLTLIITGSLPAPPPSGPRIRDLI